MSRESEYRKMERELREWIGGAQIIPEREENRFRNRVRILRVEEKEKPGTVKRMGGIRKIISRIFSKE